MLLSVLVLSPILATVGAQNVSSSSVASIPQPATIATVTTVVVVPPSSLPPSPPQSPPPQSPSASTVLASSTTKVIVPPRPAATDTARPDVTDSNETQRYIYSNTVPSSSRRNSRYPSTSTILSGLLLAIVAYM
ncbi:hypothetical protein BC831DRAFT_476931, partial [Entophlyctis helioformis]